MLGFARFWRWSFGFSVGSDGGLFLRPRGCCRPSLSHSRGPSLAISDGVIGWTVNCRRRRRTRVLVIWINCRGYSFRSRSNLTCLVVLFLIFDVVGLCQPVEYPIISSSWHGVAIWFQWNKIYYICWSLVEIPPVSRALQNADKCQLKSALNFFALQQNPRNLVEFGLNFKKYHPSFSRFTKYDGFIGDLKTDRMSLGLG